MKKTFTVKYMLCFVLLVFGVMFGMSLHSSSASALSASDWKAGDIIDDSVFYNPNTMSSQDIQNFLNSKVPVCDTNGSQIYSGSTTRAQYSASQGISTPFTCLKDYSQSVPATPADAYCGAIPAESASAATIIKQVSAACAINPQIILVLLQKETGLITDDWPWPVEYNQATGYGCPDTSSCDPSFSGFFKQVYYGARQYQVYAKQPQLFNYRVGQTSYVAYSPDSSCSGTNVTMQSQATAGLYNYTPYQPNAAVLAAPQGQTVACGAYGNHNFWLDFWNWFGNPIGPDYAWLIDSFTYSGGDNNIVLGQTETITLKARNVGRIPWYDTQGNTNPYPVRLGTWPSGRSSVFANNTWLSSSKITTVQPGVVLPNQDGIFTFQVTPTQLGTFVEGLNLVVENYQWMQWPGLSPTINVISPNSWAIDDVIYGNGTGFMDPGTSQLITVKARNTGSTTWDKNGPYPVRLGTWPPGRASPVDSGWLSPTRIDMNNDIETGGTTVPPGDDAGFQFYVTMPASGTYYERFNLLSEGQFWFNDPGLTLYLQAKTYAWQPLWFSPSTGNWNIPRNTTFTITMQALNTGTMTWTKSGNYPVRLGTWPAGRGTALATPSWINSIRPAGLVQDSVAPGQQGTFTFTAQTGSVPGMRYEAFNMVAEGVSWFQYPGFAMYVNVL